MSNLLRELGFVPEHEFAAAIGNEVATLRNWRSKGIGPAYARAGGAIVYPISAIREWLEANGVTPTPGPALLGDRTERRGRKPKAAAC